MHEFLLLALVIIYLVISYAPISGAPKPTWQGQHNEPPPRVTQKRMPQALMIPISVHEPKFFGVSGKIRRAIFDTEITLPHSYKTCPERGPAAGGLVEG